MKHDALDYKKWTGAQMESGVLHVRSIWTHHLTGLQLMAGLCTLLQRHAATITASSDAVRPPATLNEYAARDRQPLTVAQLFARTHEIFVYADRDTPNEPSLRFRRMQEAPEAWYSALDAVFGATVKSGSIRELFIEIALPRPVQHRVSSAIPFPHPKLSLSWYEIPDAGTEPQIIIR